MHKVTGPGSYRFSTLTARKYRILGILSIYAVFILDQLGTSSIGA
jgi:hypothetical protein